MCRRTTLKRLQGNTPNHQNSAGEMPQTHLTINSLSPLPLGSNIAPLNLLIHSQPALYGPLPPNSVLSMQFAFAIVCFCLAKHIYQQPAETNKHLFRPWK